MELVKYVKRQLQNRPDSEHRQAILRFVIVLLGLAYSVYIYSEVSSMLPTMMALSSLVVSAAIVGHIIWKPHASPTRRILGAIHDNCFVTAFLYFGGTSAALYLFVYPFITVGNGFRFGGKYLAFSGTLGIICLSTLIYFNPDWRSDQMVGHGIIISNILVTVYTGLLLKKLKTAQLKLEVMATHDNLTGLPNRACFMEKLEESFRSHSEDNHGIVCLYFDLDGFKSVNDIHGHKTGDVLLQSVATNVKSVIRSTDVLARLGGDEFTLLLDSKTTVEDATRLSQRIIKSIEGIKELQGKQIKVSCSIGIAYLPSSSDVCVMAPEELLKLADEAMYKAKKSGKGRFELTHVSHVSTLKTYQIS